MATPEPTWGTTTTATLGGTMLTITWALTRGHVTPISMTWTSPHGLTARPAPAGQTIDTMRHAIAHDLTTAAGSLTTTGQHHQAATCYTLAAACTRPPRPGRPPGDPRHPGRLDDVARAYSQALQRRETARAPAKAVHRAFPNYAASTVNGWIRRARTAGLIPPR